MYVCMYVYIYIYIYIYIYMRVGGGAPGDGMGRGSQLPARWPCFVWKISWTSFERREREQERGEGGRERERDPPSFLSLSFSFFSLSHSSLSPPRPPTPFFPQLMMLSKLIFFPFKMVFTSQRRFSCTTWRRRRRRCWVLGLILAIFGETRDNKRGFFFFW